MQNLIQTVMQQWPRTAVRQATNRHALLLTTSAMMAMLLVGCESDDDTPEADVIAGKIDFMQTGKGLTDTSFITAVRAGNDGNAEFEYTFSSETEGEDGIVIEHSKISTEKFTVKPDPIDDLYYISYYEDKDSSFATATALLNITTNDTFKLYSEDEDDKGNLKYGDSGYFICEDTADKYLSQEGCGVVDADADSVALDFEKKVLSEASAGPNYLDDDDDIDSLDSLLDAVEKIDFTYDLTGVYPESISFVRFWADFSSQSSASEPSGTVSDVFADCGSNISQAYDLTIYDAASTEHRQGILLKGTDGQASLYEGVDNSEGTHTLYEAIGIQRAISSDFDFSCISE